MTREIGMAVVKSVRFMIIATLTVRSFDSRVSSVYSESCTQRHLELEGFILSKKYSPYGNSITSYRNVIPSGK